MFRTDFDNATTLLSLAILDNTDHIDLVRGRVTINEAHIRFSCSKLSNIIDESFSATNLRIDENKAYIVANENAIAVNQNATAVNHDDIAVNQKAIAANIDTITQNQNAIVVNVDTIAQNQNAIAVNHDAIAENENTIVGYSIDIIIIEFY